MSTIGEAIEETEAELRALREVRKMFPDAQVARLWAGGPAVPVVRGKVAVARATAVIAVSDRDGIMLFPYTETPCGQRVYFANEFLGGFYASLVFERVAKDAQAFSALIEACRKQG